MTKEQRYKELAKSILENQFCHAKFIGFHYDCSGGNCEDCLSKYLQQEINKKYGDKKTEDELWISEIISRLSDFTTNELEALFNNDQ